MKYTLTKRGKIVAVKPLPVKEKRVQKNCIRWFDIQYPLLQQLLFHIPNGGSRNKQKINGRMVPLEAIEFKRMGVRRGVADLFLSIPNEQFHGFYIEVKSVGEKQSDAQIEFQKKVTSLGYKYSVVFTVEEFINAISNFLRTTAFYKPTWKQVKLREQGTTMPSA